MPLSLARYSYDRPPELRERARGDHVSYLLSAAAAGDVVAAGAVRDGPFGYVVIRCSDIVGARELVAADPVIQTGGASLTEIVEWQVDIAASELTPLL